MPNDSSQIQKFEFMEVVQSSKLINLGCGCRFHPDWLNLDLNARRPGVVECNFLEGIPLKDSSIQAVYSAAVLEHIPKRNALAFLQECSRVLMPGGILRISVPDFEAQARLYLNLLERAGKGELQAAEKLEWVVLEMIDQVGRNVSGGGMAEFLGDKAHSMRDFILERIGKEGSEIMHKLRERRFSSEIDFKSFRSKSVRGGVLGVLLLKFLLRSRDIKKDLAAWEVGRFRLFSGEVHQWAYDRVSLGVLFEQAGFRDIQVKPHGESLIERWRDYHLEVDEEGVVEKPDLFVMEGIKQEG
jgi:predicted SAM-dependent methyltransferase